MSEAWKIQPEKYPDSLAKCFDQGRRDFLAGYKMTWTPNLGPMTLNDKAMASWRDGWMLQRDEVIEKWMEAAANESAEEQEKEG